MNKTDIEFAARQLQIQIWRERSKLWTGASPTPIAMLDPAIAAVVLDVRFELHEPYFFAEQLRKQYDVEGIPWSENE